MRFVKRYGQCRDKLTISEAVKAEIICEGDIEKRLEKLAEIVSVMAKGLSDRHKRVLGEVLDYYEVDKND